MTHSADHPETKLCLHCQRPFHNRKKWQQRGLWPQVRYCSKSCRAAAKTKS